jgi:hypothetical protein
MPAGIPASEAVAIFPKSDIMSENRVPEEKPVSEKRVLEDVCLKACARKIGA